MQSDPILRRKHISKASAQRDHGRNVPLTIEAEGGLHYIRGNSSPYFSLTATVYRKGFPGQDYEGGCCHDLILKHWPELADLAALHLSDIDGVPGAAEANGWYWLAGALGGMGERYHGGNADHIKRPPLEIFADHCRISMDEAKQIADLVEGGKVRSTAVETIIATPGIDTPRKKWAAICETMRPRWKAEAEACIARHGLRLYGDTWDGATAWRAAHPLEAETPPAANVEPQEDGLAAIVKARGLVFTVEPTDSNPHIGDMPKGSRHFRYSISRGALNLSGVYSVGPGIVESWLKDKKPSLPMMQQQRAAFLAARGTIFAQEYVDAASGRYRPELRDVLQSLASDAQGVASSPLFEDWASDFGYDTDSRKAEECWRACTVIRHKLEQLLGSEEFAALTE